MPLPVLISFASIGAFAGSVVGQLLIGTALSALSTALQRQNQPDSPGIRTEVTTEGSVTPQTFILGRYATAGNLVAPPYATGTPQGIPNGYRVSVMDVSDMPITAWRAIWVDGDKYPVANLVQDAHSDGITYLRPASGDFKDALRIVLYDGNQTAADPYMLREFAGHSERPWQADMIGRGVAYAVLNFRYDPELYQGEPSLLFEVEGAALYDPRKDSTAGGSGAHRWGNQATWEFTENPAVMVYNLLRGITLPDGGAYGLGVDAAELPSEWWHVAMDRCDEIVGSNPRYRAGYEVKMATAEDGGDAPLDVIDELLKAMDAELCDLGGTWIIRAGAPLAAAATIADEDILRSSPQDLDPFRGMADTYNAVRASHPLPSSMWQATEAPPRYDTAAEAEDGQRLVGDIDLPAVPYPVQVQRLMRAWLKDARRMRRHTIVLPPQYSYLTPLDTIEWSSDRNGYVTKLFEIGDVEIDARSLSVRVTLRERNPADYDWQPEYELPTEAPSQVIVPISRVPLPGFQVQAVSIRDAGGTSRRAAIEMTWPSALSSDMRTIAWQIRLLSTAEKVNVGSMSDVAEGQVIVSENLLPETTYQVRARGLRERTEWTDWITVTTLAAEALAGDDAKRLRDAADDARAVGREAADLARELLRRTLGDYEARNDIRGDVAIISREQTRQITEGKEALASTREQLLAQIGENQAAIINEQIARADGDEAVAATVTQLSTRVDDAEASITTEQIARSTQDDALAARIDTIEASAGSNSAAITAEQTARANADSALASDITTLTATVDGHTGSIEQNSTVLTTLEGTITSAILLRARAGGATGEIEVIAGSDPDGASSLVRMSSDRFLFEDGVAMFGGDLQSDDFVAGTAGWRIRANGNAEFNKILNRSDMAVGALQTTLYPIFVEHITSSNPSWQPRHAGLAQVYVIGGGGAGGASADTNDVNAAGGGAAGGTSIGFVTDFKTSDTFNVVVGSGGAAPTVYCDAAATPLSGGNGGQSRFNGNGYNLVATGGAGGGAVQNRSLVAKAAGGAGSGGLYNYSGGNGGAAQSVGGSAMCGAGGGAPNFGLGGLISGNDCIRDSGTQQQTSTGRNSVPSGLIPGEVTGFLLNGAYNFQGGDGASFPNAMTTGGVGAGPGCGGGGAVNWSGTGSDGARGGAGGNGLVVVVYYGTGNLS